MNWAFQFADEVYDKGTQSNGVIIARKYEESPDESSYCYKVCYKTESGSFSYEWSSPFWLSKGHRIE